MVKNRKHNRGINTTYHRANRRENHIHMGTLGIDIKCPAGICLKRVRLTVVRVGEEGHNLVGDIENADLHRVK